MPLDDTQTIDISGSEKGKDVPDKGDDDILQELEEKILILPPFRSKGGTLASDFQSLVSDADWMEHDQHVPNEGEIAEDEGSAMGEWLQGTST